MGSPGADSGAVVLPFVTPGIVFAFGIAPELAPVAEPPPPDPRGTPAPSPGGSPPATSGTP